MVSLIVKQTLPLNSHRKMSHGHILYVLYSIRENMFPN